MKPVSRGEVFMLSALLALQWALLAWQAWRLGVTVDEPSHLVSAYLYWQGRDVLAPHDMPPLIKIAGGAAARQLDIPISKVTPQWKRQHEWGIAQVMMSDIPPPAIGQTFFRVRLPMVVFPLLVTLLIWWWARQLYSPWTGLALALATVAEPSLLGHGSFLKNDVAAAFGYLAAWYCLWRYWQHPGWWGAAKLGAALLLATIAKLSLIWLPPLVLAAIFLRPAFTPPALEGLRPALAELWRSRRPVLTHLAVASAIVVAGVVCAYQLDVDRLTAQEVHSVTADKRLPAIVKGAAQVFQHVPVPLEMWFGLVTLFQSNTDSPWVFLAGQYFKGGHPAYFWIALALKLTSGLVLLSLLGFVLGWREDFRKTLWLLAPPLLYILLASTSGLQLGVRLVMPAIPFLLLAAGKALEELRETRLRLIAPMLVALMAAESLRMFPNTASFFNVLAGGPEQGVRYLADSNLDWGQNLPDLRMWMDRKGVKFIRLAYFGSDSVWRYFERNQIDYIRPPWNDAITGGKTSFVIQPGLYAVSANLITGQLFSPKYRDYFAGFRKLKPVARAGYSILVFEVH